MLIMSIFHHQLMMCWKENCNKEKKKGIKHYKKSLKIHITFSFIMLWKKMKK